MKLATLIIAALILVGCQPINPQVAAVKSASDVAVAKEKAAAALSSAQGQDAPITHPVSALENIVNEIRPWLILFTVVAFLGWAVEFGLRFTAFSALGFLEPVFRYVFLLSLAALIALPFLPMGILIVLIVALGLIVYDLIRDHWSVKQVISDIQSEVGKATK